MSVITEAAEAVGKGGVVGLPTDTVYGLGADPWNESAVAQLFRIKDRPSNKPIGLLVASIDQGGEVAEIGPELVDLLAAEWPGALTVIVRPRVVLAGWIGNQVVRTLGIRMPDHNLVCQILSETGPLAVTSANRSGEAETLDDVTARAIFGSEVSYYVPGVSPGGTPSTVVDATGSEMVVLRPGPVSV